MIERTTHPLLALALLSAPIVTGAMVMWLAGASLRMWAGNLAAGALGLLVYAALIRAPRSSFRGQAAAAVAGALALACTLAAPGLEGVHRWLIVFGVRLHASQLVMPALLVFAAGHVRRLPALGQALVLATQAIHLLQPDAGQASAVAAASLVLLVGGARTRASYVWGAASFAAAIAAWMRPDPLLPAPFVEDIVARSFGVRWWLGSVGVISMAAATLAPMVSVHRATDPDVELAVGAPDPKVAARALTAYFMMAALVPAFGEFPVPLLGFGASSILGAFLGLAALRATQMERWDM